MFLLGAAALLTSHYESLECFNPGGSINKASGGVAELCGRSHVALDFAWIFLVLGVIDLCFVIIGSYHRRHETVGESTEFGVTERQGIKP